MCTITGWGNLDDAGLLVQQFCDDGSWQIVDGKTGKLLARGTSGLEAEVTNDGWTVWFDPSDSSGRIIVSLPPQQSIDPLPPQQSIDPGHAGGGSEKTSGGGPKAGAPSGVGGNLIPILIGVAAVGYFAFKK
jgi:hypothetical protein